MLTHILRFQISLFRKDTYNTISPVADTLKGEEETLVAKERLMKKKKMLKIQKELLSRTVSLVF